MLLNCVSSQQIAMKYSHGSIPTRSAGARLSYCFCTSSDMPEMSFCVLPSAMMASLSLYPATCVSAHPKCQRDVGLSETHETVRETHDSIHARQLTDPAPATTTA